MNRTLKAKLAEILIKKGFSEEDLIYCMKGVQLDGDSTQEKVESYLTHLQGDRQKDNQFIAVAFSRGWFIDPDVLNLYAELSCYQSTSENENDEVLTDEQLTITDIAAKGRCIMTSDEKNIQQQQEPQPTKTLRRVKPKKYVNLLLKQDCVEGPRQTPEIMEVIDELVDKVWYRFHLATRRQIAEGELEMVDELPDLIKDYSRRPVVRYIWEGALAQASRVEQKYGKKNLGPVTAYEWGRLHGKLSALEWVMGRAWDEQII